MASLPSVPDLSGIVSSSQLFASKPPGAYNIRQIRALHGHIQSAADEKAAKLWNQVGASYRELLGTADTIVRMRDEMVRVAELVGDMGRKCAREAVEGKMKGLRAFVDKGGGSGSGPEMGRMAKRRLLEGCALAVAGLLASGRDSREQERGEKCKQKGLRRGGRLVVAAKVLVLSRLLVKSLGEEHDKDASEAGQDRAVESIQKRLASVRRKLLRSIERELVRSTSTDEMQRGESTRTATLHDLVKPLSAYSLVTSLGARDVLRHFLHVRGEAMALALAVADPRAQVDEGRAAATRAVWALGLYSGTLMHVQALTPYRLAEALAGLNRQELLADEALWSLEGLRLDVHKRWCGDEIVYFRPFLRHDDLDRAAAEAMLEAWADWGADLLLRGLERVLEGMTDFRAVVDMRTDLLGRWIAEGTKVRGIDPGAVLQRMRAAFNKQMVSVVDAKVNRLRILGSKVGGLLSAWRVGESDQHTDLWAAAGLLDTAEDALIERGAAHFVADIIGRLQGRDNKAVAEAVVCYRSWHRAVADVRSLIEGALRKQKWEHDQADEVVEDKETIEEREGILSREDPERLSRHLDAALGSAFATLDSQLAALWAGCAQRRERGWMAILLVRVVRFVRANLPEMVGPDEAVSGFGLAVVPALHEAICAEVAAPPIEAFAAGPLTLRAVVARSLWEGEPALPATPSPAVFGFLRHLSVAMADAGADLWSPAAVAVIKDHAGAELRRAWTVILHHLAVEGRDKDGDEAIGDGVEDDKQKQNDGQDVGAETANTRHASDAKQSINPCVTPSSTRDLLIQHLFDVSYLRSCLAGGHVNDIEEAIFAKLCLLKTQAQDGDDEDVNTQIKRRVGERAAEYYHAKTKTLFGLLA